MKGHFVNKAAPCALPVQSECERGILLTSFRDERTCYGRQYLWPQLFEAARLLHPGDRVPAGSSPATFKDLKRTGTPHRYLEGKNIVLLFQKTSTRTRCSFEVGAMDLGMGVTYLDASGSQMGKKESIEDTARVLGRLYDGIEFRGFAQADVEELGRKRLACRCGTASPTSGTPRRCSPTCLPFRRTSTTT